MSRTDKDRPDWVILNDPLDSKKYRSVIRDSHNHTRLGTTVLFAGEKKIAYKDSCSIEEPSRSYSMEQQNLLEGGRKSPCSRKFVRQWRGYSSSWDTYPMSSRRTRVRRSLKEIRKEYNTHYEIDDDFIDHDEKSKELD